MKIFIQFITKDLRESAKPKQLKILQFSVDRSAHILSKMNSTDADQTIGIDRLYKNYEILSEAKDKITEVCLCGPLL